MAKASVLFPCLIILCLVVFATGYCSFPCKSSHACESIMHCQSCAKRCVGSCCQCDCTANQNGYQNGNQNVTIS
ncbi:hypothetical protein PHAVU_006G067300 [Phaseolus vulgaris]|uniref:Uncharacterized protein n=1 Tax=Phaseolus vulgaris TaxID=3885 RepID=V7BQ88_PHAVU|nr:hypothetical protein PHAVU_006G067300g [Phaseolus vulgaris]ESW18751.1 hypothetical protein PHAVU_006G067300g [Phaseolus vulgaris]